MLNFFRQKGLTSIIYGIIIVGMILVFVLGFNPSAGKKLGTVSEACAARVHGSCIEPKAHRAAYRLIFSRGTGGMKQATASRIVLEGLIERELLVTEAQRLGLTVSEEEITDSIFHGNVLLSLPSDQVQMQRSMGIDDGKINVGFKDPKTKQFDMKTYERMVKQITGRSPTEFREWQSRELLAAKMRDLVRAPVRVAEDEALDRFKTERTTSTVNYAVVRRSWLEKYAIPADQKDIDAWSKDKINLAQIKVPVRHVLVKFAGEKPEEKEASKAKAQGIFDRIKKGEDFAKLAKEFSDDPGSKDKGGQYPGEMVEQFVEPFKKAVESVKPGELVPNLVETQFGYHIIKRDEASKEDILKAYRQSKSLDLSKAAAAKIANDVRSGKSGDDAVKAAIAQYGTVKPAAAKPDAKDGKDGKKADAKDADAGAGKAAAADAGPAAPEYTAETDPERPQFLTSSAFNRGGDPIPAISGEASSAVTAFAFSAKAGDVVQEPIRTDDGFLVVALKEQKPATKDEFDKERDQYMQSLLFAKKAEALGNYTRRMREAAKAEIKIDENNVMGAKSDAVRLSPKKTKDPEPKFNPTERPYRVGTLGNGLRVVVAPQPQLDRAHVALYVRVGSRFETPPTNGLSHFLEHMLYRGTPSLKTAHEVNHAFESLGGYLYAATQTDFGVFSVTLPSESLAKASELFGEVLANPSFNDIDLEKGIVCEEILEDLDDEGRQVDADNLTRMMIYPTHPLGYTITGDEERVRSFTQAMLRTHHTRHYNAANSVLAFSGAVDPDAALALADKYFSHLAKGEPVTTEAPVHHQKKARLDIVENVSSQTELRVCFRAVAERSEHRAAMDMLMRIIDDGMSTRLYHRICDSKGLCYDVGASFDGYEDDGVVDFAAGVVHARTSVVTKEIIELLCDIAKNGPTEAEVEKARRRNAWEMQSIADSPEDLAGFYAGGYLFDRFETPEARVAANAAVTPKRLREMAELLAQPDRLNVLAVGLLEDGEDKRLEDVVKGFKGPR